MTAPAPTPTDDAVFAEAPAAPVAPAAPAAAAEPVAEPVPAPTAEEPTAPSKELVAPGPGGEVVAPWTHETIEFEGDTLEVRKPTQQALAAFSLASSKYVPMQVKNDITGLFISRHLSEASYGHVFSRMMDPDDGTYTTETIGDLMRSIVELSIEGLQEPEPAPTSTAPTA